ncbi:hypothetical protein [Streptomyces prasinus]
MVALARLDPDAQALFARHMDRIASRELTAQAEPADAGAANGRPASTATGQPG